MRETRAIQLVLLGCLLGISLAGVFFISVIRIWAPVRGVERINELSGIMKLHGQRAKRKASHVAVLKATKGSSIHSSLHDLINISAPHSSVGDDVVVSQRSRTGMRAVSLQPAHAETLRGWIKTISRPRESNGSGAGSLKTLARDSSGSGIGSNLDALPPRQSNGYLPCRRAGSHNLSESDITQGVNITIFTPCRLWKHTGAWISSKRQTQVEACTDAMGGFQCTWTTEFSSKLGADLVLYKGGVPSTCHTGSAHKTGSFAAYFDAERAGKREGQLWGVFEGEPFHKHAEFWRYVEQRHHAHSSAPLFDMEISWRKSADVPALYCRWLAQDGGGGSSSTRLSYRELFTPPPLTFDPSALASAFVSNPGGTWNRFGFLKKMMGLIPIKSFGRVLNNADDASLPQPSLSKSSRKIEVARRYKFGLALENEATVDYVTEKVFEFLVAGTLPVYYGAPNIDDFLPCSSKCIIKAQDFESEADLAQYLLHLDKNPDAYAEYFLWKSKPPRASFLSQMELCSDSFFCRMCSETRRRLAKASMCVGNSTPVRAASATGKADGDANLGVRSGVDGGLRTGHAFAHRQGAAPEVARVAPSAAAALTTASSGVLPRSTSKTWSRAAPAPGQTGRSDAGQGQGAIGVM